MSESTKRPAPLGDDSMHSEKRQRPENDADDITALNRVNALLDDALSLANAAFPATLNAGDNAALRKARRLARALMNALPVDPTTELIAYEKHQKYAEAVIKKLENSCANDWHDGYDYQEARMKDIGRDVGKWLPILWNALNESDADVELIWTCLHFSSKTTAFLRTVRTRHDYSIESVKVTITSGDGTAVYNENRSIDKSLLWMWRELLVHCEAHAFLAAPILMKMGQLNIMSKVSDRIRQNSDREGDANAGGVKFWDQHWDETMQNAAKRVCAARHAKQMSQFLKTPSLAVYRSLLQTNPIIRPVLTDTVRAHMADRSWVKLPLDWPEETEAAAVWDKMRLKEDSADPFGLPGLMKFLRFQLRRYTAVSDISRHFRCMAKVYSCMRQPGTFNPRLF